MGKPAILSVRIISDAKGATKGFNDAASAAGGFGSQLLSLAPGPLAVGGAIVTGVIAAGKALFDLGTTFENVEHTIRAGTGATGEALEGLIDDAHKVATSIPTDFETAGQTVADLNTRLGLSGDTLQTVASQYLEAGRILGDTVDIDTTSAAFNAFKIEGENVTGAMDNLFRVSQATGVSMNDLAGSAKTNAQALQEMGFTFTDSIALIGGLEKAGVDADATLSAMRKGLVSMAEPGQSMSEALFNVTGKLNEFIKAGDTAAATDLAAQVFGTKGATQMVQALQTGIINAEDLTSAIGTTGDTILGVGQETLSAGDKWQILKNRASEALEPLASGLLDLTNSGLDGLLALPDKISTTFTNIRTTLGNLWGSAWNYVSTTLVNTSVEISTTVSQIPGKITNALGNIGSLLTKAGKDLIRGFINGIGSMGSALWDAAKNIATNAVDTVKSFLGIHSPSRVFQQIGVYSAQGLINGLDESHGKVEKAWNSLVSLPATPVFTFNDHTRLGRQGAAPVSITVNGALDPVGVAEQIRRILAAHDLRTGYTALGGAR